MTTERIDLAHLKEAAARVIKAQGGDGLELSEALDDFDYKFPPDAALKLVAVVEAARALFDTTAFAETNKAANALTAALAPFGDTNPSVTGA